MGKRRSTRSACSGNNGEAIPEQVRSAGCPSEPQANGLTLTPYQQDFENQMDAAEKVMKKYRNALHELAK